MTNIQQLAASAPSNFNEVKTVDWVGVETALSDNGLSSNDVVAASWCSLGHMNIEALVDSPQLVMITPRGIVATVGKKKMLGGAIKSDAIEFGRVRTFGACEYTDERGFGKFCIEFAAAGNQMLGRLQWTWRGKRFKNNQHEIIAVAEERDRILGIISDLNG